MLGDVEPTDLRQELIGVELLEAVIRHHPRRSARGRRARRVLHRPAAPDGENGRRRFDSGPGDRLPLDQARTGTSRTPRSPAPGRPARPAPARHGRRRPRTARRERGPGGTGVRPAHIGHVHIAAVRAGRQDDERLLRRRGADRAEERRPRHLPAIAPGEVRRAGCADRPRPAPVTAAQARSLVGGGQPAAPVKQAGDGPIARGWMSSMWTTRVSPGSAPSIQNGPVSGLSSAPPGPRSEPGPRASSGRRSSRRYG